jgi:hypothetical protein
VGQQPVPGAAGTTQGGVAPRAGDPHPGWIAEWRTLRARIKAPLDLGPGFDIEAAAGRLVDVEQGIVGTPAATLAGAAAQLEVALARLENTAADNLAIRAVRNASAALERIGGLGRLGGPT